MGSGLGFGAYGGTGGSSRRERLLFSATNKRLKYSCPCPEAGICPFLTTQRGHGYLGWEA